jgi:hypothetical protein
MKNKRFIAGAVCPKCTQVDKVFTYELEGRKFRACTRCDFNEEMRFGQNRQELPTRVNLSARSQAEPVTLLQFPDKDKKSSS